MADVELNVENDLIIESGKQVYLSKNTSLENEYHSDQEIWKAFQGGSRIAYKLIYERHINLLYNYGNKIAINGALVEDCLQDLFVDLWIKKSKLGLVINIKAYLFTSFRRRLIEVIKKNKVEIDIEKVENLEIVLNYSALPSTISDEKRAALLIILNGLSAQKKEAIFLRFFNDLSCAEIGEIMRIKTQSVYNLISSGLIAIKQNFKNK